MRNTNPKKYSEGTLQITTHTLVCYLIVCYRGISSTVRRCIEKETGKEYAAKIIDLSNDGINEGGATLEATRSEVAILRHVTGHPYISKYLQELQKQS